MVGITGAVDDETPIGALMLPERVIDHGTGREHVHVLLGPGDVAGAMWTTDVITTADELPALRKRAWSSPRHGDRVDRPACEERGMPWSVFRCVSDRATDGSVDDDVFHLSRQDGTPDPMAVASYLVRTRTASPQLAQDGPRRQARHRAGGRRRPAALAAPGPR